MSIDNPFEVISSEDMLARVYNCNSKLEEIIKQKNEEKAASPANENEDETENNGQKELNEYDWTSDYILLGSDVRALFPSLSAKRTGISVRKHFMKSRVKWLNVDWKLVSMYIKLHESYWTKNELDRVRKLLPVRKSLVGRPPSIGTDKVETRFKWPSMIDHISDKCKAELMGLAMEIAVAFFFNNFAYTFA